MPSAATTSRWLALATLLLLPLVWLWPCVFGGRTFVPYDLAEFPPAGQQLTAEQLATVRSGANYDATEPPVWFVPELELAHAELRAGRAPTWNPHARGGTPLHAHGLIGLCYPPNWLALLAEHPADRLALVVWIDLALAGLLAFGLFRALGFAPLVAWFGAAAFELSAPMAVNAYFWMRLASLVWLPGVLWGLLCLSRSDRLRGTQVAATAGAFAMAWLGGFPPFAAATAVIAGLFALWLAVAGVRREDGSAMRIALRTGLALALGGLLAMPQILPSLRFFPLSARTPTPSAADIAGSAYEVYGLAGYLLPDFVSHPTAAADLPYDRSPVAIWLNQRQIDGRPVTPNYNYTEYAVFVGTWTLLLAAIGAFAGRGRHAWFARGGLLLLLGLALHAPGIRALFALPVVQNVWPMRWLAPATLLVAWLAALGLERLRAATWRLPAGLGAAALLLAALVWWLTGRPAVWQAADQAWLPQAIAAKFGITVQGVVDYVTAGRPGFDRFAAGVARLAASGERAALALAVAAAFAALAMLRRGRARDTVLLLAGLATLVELSRHGAPLTQGRRLDHPLDTPVHAFLREQAAAAAPDGGFAVVRGSVVPGQPAQLPPGELLVPGLRDLNFYTHFDGRSAAPLRALLGGKVGERDLGDRAAAKGYLALSLPDALPCPGEPAPAAPYPVAAPLAHPLLDLLGVRYVLATEPLQHAGARVGPALRGPGGEFFVYERPNALPRAFTVAELRPLADDAAVVAALVEPTFAPRAQAFAVAAEVGPAPGNATGAPARPVRFVIDHPTEIELDVGAGAAPWLVLTDTWLPGWRATIDGDSATPFRVDHCCRGLRLPERACRVRFRYEAPGLALGFALAAFATLALLVLTFATRRARRQPPQLG